MEDNESADNDTNDTIIMISIGIISVVFMWTVIIGCYWSPKTKQQEKYNPALSPTLSTTLLIHRNDSSANDNGSISKLDSNDGAGLI